MCTAAAFHVETVSVGSSVKAVYLFSLSVEGLHAIVVTDRDGVPVIKGETLRVSPSVLLSSVLG